VQDHCQIETAKDSGHYSRGILSQTPFATRAQHAILVFEKFSHYPRLADVYRQRQLKIKLVVWGQGRGWEWGGQWAGFHLHIGPVLPESRG